MSDIPDDETLPHPDNILPFAVPNHHSHKFVANPPTNPMLTFTNWGKEVGKLNYDNGILTFSGNADLCAKVMFEKVVLLNNSRMAELETALVIIKDRLVMAGNADAVLLTMINKALGRLQV
jgi:hypothetical protein